MLRNAQTIDTHQIDELNSSMESFIRHLPPLNTLRSFEAAARLGSFNGAAKELFVTPSAVSHQIKTLEAFVEQKLFIRHKRTVLLTEAGKSYLQSIQNALDEIDRATRRLIYTPTTNIINLAVAPAFLTRWLVPRLGLFQQKHPSIELRLSASMGEVDFQQSDTDMAIYLGSGHWRGMEAYFLLGTEIAPVCSPELLSGPHPLHTLNDLKLHTLIHVASRADEWPQLLSNQEIPPSALTHNITFSNTSLALGAAIEGVGVALSDLRLVERELKYKQLVTPFNISLDTGKAFYLVHPQDRTLSPAMETFRDWLLTELQITAQQPRYSEL